MTEELKERLFELALKYENEDFIQKDPSRFMHMVNGNVEQEVVAFVSANMAFGRRDQILKHIEMMAGHWGSDPLGWIVEKRYEHMFDESDDSFYRMYTNRSMRLFFDGIRKMIVEKGSIGAQLKEAYENECRKNEGEKIYLAHLVPQFFHEDCNLIARGKDGAQKKLNMFLRWMVRDGSPVDLGLWSGWYSKGDLLMPLDTHVMQEATNFNLLERTSSGKTMGANFKTALMLTDAMREVFGDDPVRGDFALFGLGVDVEKK